MSDWSDDEDFGTFESGDRQTIQPSSAAATPSWLLETHHVKSPIENLSRNTSKTGSNESLKLLKPQKTTFSSNYMNHVPTVKEQDKSTGNIKDDPYKELRQINSTSSLESASSLISNQSVTKIKSGLTEKKSNIFDTPIINKNTTSDSVLETHKLVSQLEAKLNTAVVLKNQSESNLTQVRESLTLEIENLKGKLKEKELNHNRQLDQMKTHHEQQLNELKLQFEHTNEEVQSKLKEIYETNLQHSQLQYEKKLVKVCDDCTTLMKQQNEIFSEKLSEETQKERVQTQLIKCEIKEELRNMIKSITDEICDKIEKKTKLQIDAILQKEMENYLEEGRTFTSKLQKDTNDKFLLEFKLQISDLMKIERTKNEQLVNDSIVEVKQKILENLNLENQKCYKSLSPIA